MGTADSNQIFGPGKRSLGSLVSRPRVAAAQDVGDDGEPRLWVIGRYEMGFEITASEAGSSLRVCICYDLPASGLPRLLGRLFSRFYARWCTAQMVTDARTHFLDTEKREASVA